MNNPKAFLLWIPAVLLISGIGLWFARDKSDVELIPTIHLNHVPFDSSQPATTPIPTSTPTTPAPTPPPTPQVISPALRMGTPYDHLMGKVLKTLRTVPDSKLDIDEVNDLVKKGREFKYIHTDDYFVQSPSVTESKKAGDCKDKALWLASKIGGTCKFIIGKETLGSEVSHAWVEWEYKGQTYLLDPTLLTEACLKNEVAENKYRALFSFDRNGSWTLRLDPVATQ